MTIYLRTLTTDTTHRPEAEVLALADLALRTDNAPSPWATACNDVVYAVVMEAPDDAPWPLRGCRTCRAKKG